MKINSHKELIHLCRKELGGYHGLESGCNRTRITIYVVNRLPPGSAGPPGPVQVWHRLYTWYVVSFRLYVVSSL